MPRARADGWTGVLSYMLQSPFRKEEPMRLIRPIHHDIACLPSQDRFYRCKAKFKGFSGAVGSGKTVALCCEALLAASRNPGCTGFIGGPTYPHLYDVVIPTMVGILEELHVPFELRQGSRPR